VASKLVIRRREMNPEVKKIWLDKLRSGKYEQGIGFLHTLAGGSDGTETFCCLGVLCEAAKEAGVVRAEKGSLSNTVYYGVDGEDDQFYWDKDDSVLPESVQEWAGLKDSNPQIMDKEISSWNDGDGDEAGASFAEIADLIEVNL